MRSLLRLASIVIAFVLALGGGYLGYNRIRAGRSAQAAPSVRLVAVERGNLAATVATTGPLVPVNQIKLSFKSGGRLKEMKVRVGDPVTAGQELAKIDTTDLEFTLSQNLITLQTNQLKLAQLKAGPQQNDMTIAKVNLDKAQLALQKAQGDYDKVAWRNDVGLTPQAAALQSATLDYQSALAAYAKATQGSTATDVQVAENTVKTAQLAVDQARANLQGATIVAPFSGVVSAVNGNIGEPAQASAPVITVIDLSSLRVEANIDEQDIGRVKIGQQVALTFDGLPDLRLTGKVTAIAPSASSQAGVVTYLIYVVPDQTNAQLRAGMTATANIIVDQRQNVLFLPNRAVKNARGLRTVQVLQDGRLVDKQVEVGLSDDTNIEIVRGLQEGDEVAVAVTSAAPATPAGLNFFGGARNPTNPGR